MTFIESTRFKSMFRIVAVLAAVGMATYVQAAKIAWVSFHTADGTPSANAAAAGFVQAPDVEYTRLLQSAGHTVTRILTSSTPDVAALNTYDLVIISRSVASGNFQTADSTALWHSITKPTIILGGYVLRASRLGYVTGETIPDTTNSVLRLTVNNPAHAIFTGVNLDAANTMANPYSHSVSFNGALQSGISVNMDAVADGGTVLATVGTEGDPAFGGTVIAEFPAGTTMADASADVTAGKRLIFLTGSRERGITGDGAGIFDLEVDGARLFLNSVSYMTGSPIVELPPLLTAERPSVGATQYYAPLGMALRATSGNAGGIPATNITLTLNGKDVTSALTIGGTSEERLISYNGLVANTNYTGVLTVKDARGLQSALNLNFDTLPPFTLPATFAYPTNAAVVASPGMQARIVQAYDYSTLANTSDRAESQLAGTLVDPDTTQPFPNLATPSTDNSNGAYNQQTINWSVNAGGTEIGSFQGPTFPDQLFPGVAHNLNFAAEVITYLELVPGRYLMGVNSDDGFVVYTGAHPRDAFAVALGRFDGGRGSADTTFQFEVSEAGLYPFRVVYYQGTGDGNLEWFTVVPETGEKILVNDRSNPRAVRAWRQLSVPERPYVVSMQPSPGQIDVEVASNVTVKLQDAGAQVQEGTVRVTLNGQAVTAQATKSSGVTTVVYDPAQDLPSDTKEAVALTYTDSASNQRTINYEFTTKFVPPTQKGANIVWVSFHAEDNQPSAAAVTAGFTNAADIGYTQLLRSAGHTVTRYVTTAAPDPAFLDTFDLVIISRAVPSGNYQTADSTLAWNSIKKPTMILGGYIIRKSRLGYTTGETIPDTTTTNNLRLKINAPAHPIFSGIQVDAATNMVNAYAHRTTFNGILQRGISVNSDPIISGGTVLATIGTQTDPAFGGMVIGEYPAGIKMSDASGDIAAGKRLIFLTGSRENDGLTSEGAGIFDLDGDGSRMFLNAVQYMAGLVDEPPATISISASLSANGVVVSWPEAGSEGFALQSSPTLSAANWQPVAGTPAVSNGRRTMTVPATGTSGFLRLAKP